jgi:hypothetical protein
VTRAPFGIVLQPSNNVGCPPAIIVTANPRIEQNVISNDRVLFDFHREWMVACLTGIRE